MKDFFKDIAIKLFKIRDLSFIGVADISGNIIASIFWFYIASQLQSEHYGEIHFFIGIASLAQTISLIGNSNIITVFSAKNQRIVSTLLILSLTVGSICSVVILFIFSRIDVSFLVIGLIMIQFSSGILIGKKLYKKYLTLVLIQKSLLVILGIALHSFFGNVGLIYAIFLSSIPYTLIIGNELREKKIIISELIQKKEFIINNYSVNISGNVTGQIDKIIIAPVLGYTLLGNYALSLQFLAVAMIIPLIIYKYTLSNDSSGNENKKLKITIIFISIFISIFLAVIFPYSIPVFFSQYTEIIVPMQIMIFSLIPGTFTLMYTSKLLANEKSRSILITKIVDASIIIIGFLIFGPIYGIIGLSIIYLTATFIEAILIVIIDKISINNQ